MLINPSNSAAKEGILIIGAGELGASILNALSQREHRAADLLTLAVMLRQPTTKHARQRVSTLATKGIAFVHADVAEASVSELAAIMGRYHSVVSCVGMTAGKGTQLKLTEAAIAAAVPRFLPWQFGMDYDAIGRGSPQDLFDEQLDVRDALRGQETTTWVIVSTGMFTSFLLDPKFGVVDLAANTVHALGSWDNEVTITTPEDIGTLTAEIIHTQPRIANQVVYLAGDTITFRQLADIIDQMGGTPATRTVWTLPYLLAQLKRHPNDAIAKYHAVFAAGRGIAWPKDCSFNSIRGISTTTAAQWAHTHLATCKVARKETAPR